MGKTTRYLSIRISEHLRINYRSDIKLTTAFSAIRNHIQSNINDHLNFNLTKDQFKVVSSARTDFELSLKEGLLIKSMKPSLNDMGSINLKLF